MSLDSMPISELIDHLRDFRLRRDVRLELRHRGAHAVEPLLELLNNSDETLVWCAVHTLGEIGDQRAVQPLIGLLKQGKLQVDVADALKMLTGKDYGTDATVWAEQSTGDGQERKELPPEILLQQVLEGTDWTLSQEAESWTVVVPVKGNRSQDVSVLFGMDDGDGQELILTYTQAAPAHEKYFEAALRKNPQLPYGAIGVRDVRGEPMFVVSNSMLRQSADADSLRRSIASVAQRGDSVEKALTGLDSN